MFCPIPPTRHFCVFVRIWATPFLLANLTPIGSAAHSPLTIPGLAIGNLAVAGSVVDPVATDLVVEIEALDFTGGFTFIIGSNPNGQTAPSYLRSAFCGAPEPTDAAVIGFPNMHILMVVNGTEASPGVPTVDVPALDKVGLVALLVLLIAIGVFTLRRR